MCHFILKGSIMKKNINSMLMAALFIVPCATQAEANPSYTWNFAEKAYVCGTVLGVGAAGSLVVASLYKYGSRFTKCAIVGTVTSVGAWMFWNNLAATGILETAAKALATPLIPENNALSITLASIFGALGFGTLAFHAMKAYLTPGHNTQDVGVGTQTTVKHFRTV
jgi:hypothetical protein